MKYLFGTLFILVISISCKNTASKPPAETEKTDSTAAYLPIPELIKEDINRVDSFAGGFMLKRIHGSKRDSGFIPLVHFRQMASIFLDKELDAASFAKMFTESSLMDETTGMLNFIYTANSSAGAIRKAVVYLQPSMETDKISRVYLERSYLSGDTLVEQRLTWKMKAYFIVATARTLHEKPLPMQIEKVIWDPSLFEEE